MTARGIGWVTTPFNAGEDQEEATDLFGTWAHQQRRREREYGLDPINAILDGRLYQGGAILDEGIIDVHEIDIVANVSYEPPLRRGRLFSRQCTEIVHPIQDGPITLEMARGVERLAAFLAGEIRDGSRVLSHCQMGWNRSGLLTGLILVNLGFDGDAVEHIRRRRHANALCNESFAEYVSLRQRMPMSDLWDAMGLDRRSPLPC